MTLPPDACVSFRGILRHVRRHPGATCDEIAEAQAIEACLVSGALRLLKRRGLVIAEGTKRGRGYWPA